MKIGSHYRKLIAENPNNADQLRMQQEVEQNFQMVPEENVLIEYYLEALRQFGFIVLFANSFALAAVFSFFTNLFEVKIKMNNLLYYCRRPNAEVTNGIGEWEKVV